MSSHQRGGPDPVLGCCFSHPRELSTLRFRLTPADGPHISLAFALPIEWWLALNVSRRTTYVSLANFVSHELSPPGRPTSRCSILSSNNSKAVWKNLSIQSVRSETTWRSVDAPESPGIGGNSDFLDLSTRFLTLSYICRRSVGHNKKQTMQSRLLMRLTCVRSSAKRESAIACNTYKGWNGQSTAGYVPLYLCSDSPSKPFHWHLIV